MRMPDVTKFDRDRIANISFAPWSMHEVANPDGVFIEKTVIEKPEENIMKARNMYIRQADLDRRLRLHSGMQQVPGNLGTGQG